MAKIRNKITGEIREISDEELEQYKAGGKIHIKESKKGSFKAQATKMGMGVQEAASKILNAPEGKYSPEMRRKANFAKNFAKEYGGLQKYQFAGFTPNDSDTLEPIVTAKDPKSSSMVSEDFLGDPFSLIQEPEYNRNLSLQVAHHKFNKTGKGSTIYTPDGKMRYDEPTNRGFNPINIGIQAGNPYINKGIRYLNDSINHGLAIGTDYTKYKAPYNSFDSRLSPVSFTETKRTKQPEQQRYSFKPLPKGENGLVTGNGTTFTPDETNTSSWQQNTFNLGQALGTTASAFSSGINFGKGTLDILGSANQNNFAQLQEQKQMRANLIQQAMNNDSFETQGSSWEGTNALFELGGRSQSTFKTPRHLANAEVEDKETFTSPDGFSDTFEGETHANGGIPVNLEPNTKIFSEKLVNPDTKKSFARMAKRFETKKDFDILENPKASELEKATAKLNISLKNREQDKIFNIQETMKLGGVFGDKVMTESMESYNQFNLGGLKKYQNGALTKDESSWIKKTYPEIDVTDLSEEDVNSLKEAYFKSHSFTGVNPRAISQSSYKDLGARKFLPYTSDELEKMPLYADKTQLISALRDQGISADQGETLETLRDKLKSLRQIQINKDPELAEFFKRNFTRGNQGLFKEYAKAKFKGNEEKARKAGDINFFNWATENNKLLGDYLDAGKWGHEIWRTVPQEFGTKKEYDDYLESLKSDPDWAEVKPGIWADKSYNAPGQDPTRPFEFFQPFHKESKEEPTVKTDIKKEQPKAEVTPAQATVQENVMSPSLNVDAFIPEVYSRTPLNYYRIEPQKIDPRYLNIQPQLNDINRGLRTIQTNLGDRGTASMGNLLQAQANAYNAQQGAYGNKYNYDRQQDLAAQQFNAQSEQGADQYNQQSWFQQLEDPIRRREGNIGTQQLIDRRNSQENRNAAIQFKSTKDLLDSSYSQDNLLPLYLAKLQADAIRANQGEEKPKKTYGGKIKIKPKMKLK